MNKGIQELFNELIKEYNLRAITIDNETWYGINDLPLSNDAVRKNISRLRKDNENFVNNNTKLIIISDVTSSHTRNFDKINNRGETFGNFKMVNYLIMNSRLGAEYKINLIEILDTIRIKGYYIDNDISAEQVEELKQEVNRLKFEKLYGATEIVKLINIPNLLSSSLFRYLDEILQVGDYKVKQGNKNRTFVSNEEFKDRVIKIGVARLGKGNHVLFFKEFANYINNCESAIDELKRINIEETRIKDKSIEKKKENKLF